MSGLPAAGGNGISIPRIVAHRGASYAAPENTRASFRLAWAEGADAVEGDFRLTRDGQVVCLHDEDTLRTGGVRRSVADSTLAELREIDVGAWKGPSWKGERLPTLEDVLDLLPPGKSLFLEIKSGPAIVPRIREILASRRIASEQIVFISFDAAAIEAAKRLMPEIEANWLTGFHPVPLTGRWIPDAVSAVRTAQRIRADGVSAKAHPAVDEAFAAHLRGAGLGLHVWVVNEAGAALRFIGLGARSLTTDRPGPLREEMRPAVPDDIPGR